MAAKTADNPFTIFAEGDMRPLDLDMVRKAVSVLFSPGERHEIRPLPGAQSKIVTSDDVDAAVATIESLTGASAIYFSLNPIEAGAIRASAKTVVARRWFFVDIDTIRPEPDVSATEDEKAEAAKLMDRILYDLGEAGWPDPIVADSGNGWHILYRVDLPADRLTHSIFKAALDGLARKYNTASARVDTGVHDAARICKLPGTWSKKGPDVADRPHRRASLMYAPDPMDVVDVELLKKLGEAKKEAKSAAPIGPVPPTVEDDDPFVRVVGKDASLGPYIEAAVTRECVAVSITPVGERNNRLTKAAFRVGRISHWPEFVPADALEKLRRAAESFGPLDYKTIDTISRAYAAGKDSPRDVPIDHASRVKAAAEAKAAAVVGKKATRYAHEIKPEKIKFLWPGRIPLGKLTTFAGQGGLGKTFVLCDLAVRVATGSPWPLGEGECAEPGDVLFISGEDDEADTLVPRIMGIAEMLAGVKPQDENLVPQWENEKARLVSEAIRRIAFLSEAFADVFNVVDLKTLKQAVESLKEPKLIIIDPPSNFIEGVNDHKNAELRSMVLKPLSRFAAQYNTSIIFNNHVNKSTGDDVDAASRVMGSVAWVNGVRAAYMFTRDKSAAEVVTITNIKINIGKRPTSLLYEIKGCETDDLKSLGAAYIDWKGESTTTAEQAVRSTTAGERAARWLADLFMSQREWTAKEIRQLAKDAGISGSALYESREVNSLPILKRKRTSSQGETSWFWIAEKGWPGSSGSSGSCSVSPDAATHIQDPDFVEGNQDVGRRQDVGRKQDPGVRQDPERPLRASGSSKSNAGQGFVAQDPEDPEDPDGGRDPFLDQALNNL